jgi:aminopeptidase N
MAANGLAALARTRRVDSREAETAAVNALIVALDDPWELVARSAIQGLRDWGDPRAIPALERAITTAPDERSVRLARQTILRLQKGRHAGQEAQRLRGDLEEMREENRKLRARLEALEARMGSADGVNGASAAAASRRRTRRNSAASGAAKSASAAETPASGNGQTR